MVNRLYASLVVLVVTMILPSCRPSESVSAKQVVTSLFEAVRTGDSIAVQRSVPDSLLRSKLWNLQRIEPATVRAIVSKSDISRLDTKGDTVRVSFDVEANGRTEVLDALLLSHNGEWTVLNLALSSRI